MKKHFFSKKIIITAVIVMIFILGSIIVKHQSGRKLVMSCAFELQTQSDNKDFLKRFTTLNVHYFFYNDNTGFRSDFGKTLENDKSYTIDRDLIFTYSDKDKDGIYTVNINKTIKKHIDNAPFEVVPDKSKKQTSLYISFNKINDDIYYLQERARPFILCTKN
ncbi:hypothetical protein ACTWOG_004820 [Serratia marcescens]